MALKKETIQRIAALAKIKVEDLETAIKDEKEIDVAIDEKLSVLSDDEIATLKNNEYKSGKEKGVEMAVKEVKEKQGLDFTGKTIDGLLDAHKKKVMEDAKVEPNQKVQELETKITTLQSTVKDYETKITEKDNEVSSTKVNTELYKFIPSPKEDGPAFDQDDVIDMMKRKGYDFKYEGGKVVPYKDGNKVTDKLSNDLPVKDVVEGFLKEKKLIGADTTPGGRGGGDNKTPTVISKMSELKKQFTEQGKSLIGQEFTAAFEQARKDNPEFTMD